MSSEKFDNRPIFKKGQIEMHDPSGRREMNFRRTREQAAALTEARNTRKSLENNFFRISPIYRREFPQRGMVQIMQPTSPYAYGGVMVIAAGKTFFTNTGEESPEDIISTETAFDLERDIRIEYFKQILACIQAEEDTLLPREEGDVTLVIAYENNMADISTMKHRLPRTISFPHTHIIKSGDWFNEADLPVRPYGFKIESGLLQDEQLFEDFLQFWQHSFQDNNSATPDMRMRTEAPLGYTIVCPINRSDSLLKQAEHLSNVLTKNHQIYNTFITSKIEAINSKRKLRRRGLNLPKYVNTKHNEDKLGIFSLQPSYRIYIYYDNNKLRVTISPMFLAPVGALQAMDTGIHRSSEHVKYFSNAELDDFFMRFKKAIVKKLS